MLLVLQSGWHSSGTLLESTSALVSLARSHSSGMPLLLQSRLVPVAMSHSSGMSLALQSWLVELEISVASSIPLPLQSRGTDSLRVPPHEDASHDDAPVNIFSTKHRISAPSASP